jgi:hypothetical protein
MTKSMLIRKLSGSGGEAYNQWKDDPGAMWHPPSANGAIQAHPIPNSKKRNRHTSPIPNTQGMRGNTGKYT